MSRIFCIASESAIYPQPSHLPAPICLPERGSDFLGQYGWAAGWGALSPGSRLRPRTLQAVDVPVLDNRVCERWHRANGELEGDGEIREGRYALVSTI